MNEVWKKNFLVIEAGLDGGSVTIIEADGSRCGAGGDSRVSRSEDLLDLIEECLARTGISKKDIGAIIVSTGAGSLTGHRIGAAMAKGLGDSLAIPVFHAALLEAQILMTAVQGAVVSAVYTPRDGFFARSYRRAPEELVSVGDNYHERDLDRFISRLESLTMPGTSVVMHEKLANLLTSDVKRKLAEKNNLQIVEGEFGDLLYAGLKKGEI